MRWAEVAFQEAGLGGRRRNRRLIHSVERLSESPAASIPEACAGWSETQAAYRLLRAQHNRALPQPSIASFVIVFSGELINETMKN